MSNGNVTRLPVRAGTQQLTTPGQQNWMWDGSKWVWCFDPDDFPPFVPSPCPPGAVGQFPFCPPPGFPPAGCPPWFSGMNSPPWYPGANAGVSFGAPNAFPANVVRGHFFWDGKALWLFDGAAWVTVGGAPGTPGGGAAGAGTVIISTSPPGNPAVGSQWWDGSQLRMWDGVEWKVIGPGAATGPVPTTTNTFTITQPGYTSGIGAGWGIFPFTSQPTVDSQLAFDSVTKKITPKKAGIYFFEVAGWEGTGGGLALAKNDPGTFGDTTTDNLVGISTSSAAGHLTTNGMTLMNGTTDFVRLFAYSASGQIWGGGAPPMIAAWLMP